MTKPLIYVARQIPEVGLELLRQQTQLRLHEGDLPPTREELLRGIAGCVGILSLLSDRIDSEVFNAAGSDLRVVSNFAVGTNNIDIAEAERRGIAVGNTPDVLTDATADIAVSLLLGVARRMKQGARDVEEGRWKTWEPRGWIGLDLAGKTLGIVGMGRIGEAVARRLWGGWQMKIVYTARHPKLELDSRWGARHVELPELLATSDFVSLHVPLTPETHHLIDARALSLMKPTSVLINTARGEVVEQDALVEALRGGRLFGAGLDVCTPEPLPLDSPLLRLDNCLILPHIGSATVDARNAMAERAANNLLAGIHGKPLPFPV
ncbi:MAG: D-glycerate dehydrogenase [Planctomycetales bacterium]|nr:D-glycerate dehydrogenase [Planctomycetales bacterium]MCA9179803.1 D-glycerate dehydrogenase [Planctomycetales bacterium]